LIIHLTSSSILSKLVTAAAIKGRRLFKDIDREILIAVIPRKEIALLTEIVQEIYPDSFLTIHNVHEVIGEDFRNGFRS